MNNENQTTRRLKFGLNVTVAVLAAIILTVLINVIAYHRFVRIDMTATRRYTLADQTMRLLRDLEGDYRIVALISKPDPAEAPQVASYVDSANDLLEEYEIRSRNIVVDQIDPTRNISQTEAFYESLVEQYDASLAQINDAIGKGRSTLEKTRDAMRRQTEILREVLKSPEFPEGDLKKLIQNVAMVFQRFDSDYDQLVKQVEADLEQPLPDYAAIKQQLQGVLMQLDERVFAVVIAEFANASTGPGSEKTPNAIKEQLLRLTDLMRGTREQVKATLTQVQQTPEVADYSNLRRQITRQRDNIVVMGPSQQIQVLAFGEMFRLPDEEVLRQLEPGEQPEMTFQGEEKITGALVSMSLQHKPLVVFVNTSQMPALGRGGSYNNVGQRLRDLAFDVQEWNPGMRMGPGGRPMPPQPAPQPEPGQTAVWIILPQDMQPNPRNPMAGAQAMQPVAGKLQERLAVGDRALVMLTASPMSGFGGGDPVADVIKPFGINPLLDRVVHYELITPDRRKQGMPQITVEGWPDASPISQALGALPGVFVMASPLELDASKSDAQLKKLVVLNQPRMWASTDFATAGRQGPEFDETTAADSFTIGATVETDKTRLIVICDPAWATDQIINYGFLGPGTAELMGARFPANGELFINSIYWLAGRDDLIASSARTQDIRRIKGVDPGARFTFQWALPLALVAIIAASGLGVWYVRRQE